MTWQDCLYARCATNLVSFQAELFNDGSVAYRYDGSPVGSDDFVVPLELPFDRDGDGLENSVDPGPDVAGPDAHGTNAEWYNTVCSNVLTAVEGGGAGPTGVSPVACGPMVLPSSMTLGPYEGYYASFICEGAAASGSADDVSISGTFTENGTGEQVSADDSLTVVRVEFKPIVTAPNNDCIHRHDFGVCEYVEHLQYPSAPAVSWNPIAGSEVVYAGSPHFQCPLWGVDNPLRADVGTVHYTPKIQVVEPKWISSKAEERPVVYPDVVQKGEAGCIGMRLHLYVEPIDVSFSEISVEEVPCLTYEANGYFANPYYNGAFGHTRLAGAGRWIRVLTDGNELDCVDIAAYKDKIPWLTPNGTVTTNAAYAWTDGEVYIDNPFGWNVAETKGDTLPYKEFGHDIRDTIRIDGQGRVGVFKLDNWVERKTNDVIRLYGPKSKKND